MNDIISLVGYEHVGVPRVYLGPVMRKNGGIVQDVSSSIIRYDHTKRPYATGVLGNKLNTVKSEKEVVQNCCKVRNNVRIFVCWA